MQPTYSPSEVAEILGISKGELLEWERDGRIPAAPRNEDNHRIFSGDQLHEIMERAGRCPFKRISIVNQKGGVGKTTTTFNLGACLAYTGQRVLVVDLDAQANLTISFGLNPDDIDKTSNDLLVDESVTLDQVIHKTDYSNLWCVPADIRLAGADVKLREMIMREKILDGKLEAAKGYFNFVLFDCPPNLSSVTINALVASTDAIVPIETQFYSMKAIDDLTSTFNLIKRKMNHAIKTWILPTKIDNRIKVHRGILEMLEKSFGGKLLSPIMTDAKVSAAPMVKQPIIYSFPASRGTRDFKRLCQEVLSENEQEAGGDVRRDPREREREDPTGGGDRVAVASAVEACLGEGRGVADGDAGGNGAHVATGDGAGEREPALETAPAAVEPVADAPEPIL